MDKKSKLLKKIILNLLQFLFIISFIMIFSNIFGEENTLIAVCGTTALMMFTKIGIGVKYKQAPFLIIILFAIIGIATRLSAINPIIGILINFIAIFFIIYLSSGNLKSKCYLPFILGYIFVQCNQISDDKLPLRLLIILIIAILTIAVYLICNRNKSDENNVDLKSFFNIRHIFIKEAIFAFKMASGISIAMLIGDLIGLKKSMWIALSVMSVTQIDFKDTRKKFKERIIFTIIGAFAFVLLFDILVPNQYYSILTLLLGYIYSFVNKYNIQMIFVTISALSSSLVLFSEIISVSMRISLVILGCTIGYVINKIDYIKIIKYFWKKRHSNKLCLNEAKLGN